MHYTPWETVWEFNTNRYTVRLDVAPETDTLPEDNFSNPEDVEFAREGGWHWFMARVQVLFRDTENPNHWAVTPEIVLGRDYLGGCSYNGLDDFRNGDYFRDMVRSATSEARGTLERLTKQERIMQ